MTAYGRSTSRSAASCQQNHLVCCCNAMVRQGGLLHAHSVVVMFCLVGQRCLQRLASCDCLSAAVTEAVTVWAAIQTCTAGAALRPECTPEHQPASWLPGQVHDWHTEQQQLAGCLQQLPQWQACLLTLMKLPDLSCGFYTYECTSRLKELTDHKIISCITAVVAAQVS